MATVNIVYATSAQFTITLASLATSSTLLVGQESTSIDNGTNLFVDYLLSGKITTGTNPTADKKIEIWVAAPIEDAPAWPTPLDGTNSAETFASIEVKNSAMRLAHVIATNASSDIEYSFSQLSVANLFGGVCPKEFVVFITHDTAVNLNSTAGNHEISVQGIEYTIV